MKKLYDQKSRRADDLAAFLDLWPDDYFDEVGIVENADGVSYQVHVVKGEARTGFGLDQRDLNACLHIKEARKTIADQLEAMKE